MVIIIVKWGEGTVRWREDLKVQMGVLMFRGSEAYCRARLWITLRRGVES